jgi:hypothetical protein
MRLHGLPTPTILGLGSCRHGRGIEAGSGSLTDNPVKEVTGLAPGSEGDPIRRNRLAC